MFQFNIGVVDLFKGTPQVVYNQTVIWIVEKVPVTRQVVIFMGEINRVIRIFYFIFPNR